MNGRFIMSKKKDTSGKDVYNNYTNNYGWWSISDIISELCEIKREKKLNSEYSFFFSEKKPKVKSK